MHHIRLPIIVTAFLLLVFGASAHDDDKGVVIRFAAQAGEKKAVCGMIYDGIGNSKSSVQINDFRFFVSNVRLLSADGKETPLELVQDNRWQYKDTALLDFEDGRLTCSEAGNDLLNDAVVGKAPEGKYTGIVFNLGVPFELNHLDNATAPSPLNVSAMWWVWQVGYKFVRIDLMSMDGAEPAPWFIHLGSTGCDSPNENTPPKSPCSRPNLSEIRLTKFDAGRNVIVADLAGLVKGVNLKENMPKPPGCMSGPDDSDCAGLFPGFGLSLDKGVCPDGDCSKQSFFRVE
jgi:uncharacterized repeat protein (TIGR04052 family)